jgi:hypothetical protein
VGVLRHAAASWDREVSSRDLTSAVLLVDQYLDARAER